MCGIAGLTFRPGLRRTRIGSEHPYARVPESPASDVPVPMPLTRMLTALRHRGPDTEGVYVQDRAGIAFGMRRLAIMDPEHGHQPIFGDRDDVALVLNGEIYNAPELARGLRARGHRFASGSDAEVVVHLYEERGLDAFRSLSGMYAAAL